MKTVKLIIYFLLLALTTPLQAGNTTDSIKINEIECKIKKEIILREQLGKEIASQKQLLLQQAKTIDSLTAISRNNEANIKETASKFGVKLNETNSALSSKADTSDVKLKTICGILLFVLLAIIGGLISYILHKKITTGANYVNSLKQKAEKINEEILCRFTSEMAEMQKISSSLETISKAQPQTIIKQSVEPDHSLIKALADRITFMEMTLYKMDSKVRGHKQLSKSIAQMKDNLLANGYELVNMLGKSYNDGMKVTANFIEDEELEVGKQIITGIIKPQINYKGTMIQAAQITVSQNI